MEPSAPAAIAAACSKRRTVACSPSTAIQVLPATPRALESYFPGRLKFVVGRYAEMREIAEREGIAAVDGVALDLGVSSMQLDEAERGFSFSQDGPLDMRMGAEGLTASDLVNALPERDLAAIIATLGEEKRARAIARAIVARRAEEPITRTGELADIVARVLGRKHDDPKHPATRTFQALRLYLNEELLELARGLSAAEHLLAPNGQARRRHLSFARRPHRQAVFRRAQHARAKGLPPFAGEGRIKFFTKLPTS